MNGGFPEPPPGAPVRVVAASHERCGTRTTLRIPAVLSALAVRRVHCAGCGEPFAAGGVSEVGAASDRPAPLARLREAIPDFGPSSRAWRLASIPIAAALVIGGLLLIQGGDENPAPTASSQPAPEATDAAGPARPLAQLPGEPAGARGDGGGSAEIVRGSQYSLALPSGWEKAEPPAGATFAAVAANGEAEATLWISEDAGLEFPAFIAQSLQQLQTLGPNPEVCERVPGPTPETTVVRLCADVPAGQPSYEAVLRAAGPYRYYLALTTNPDASSAAVEGLELLAGSLTPEVRR